MPKNIYLLLRQIMDDLDWIHLAQITYNGLNDLNKLIN